MRFAHKPGERDGIRVDDPVALQLTEICYVFMADNFRSRGDDDYAWLFTDHHLENAGCDKRTHVIGADYVVLRKQQLSGYDVFTDLPDVLPGIGRLHDLDVRPVQFMDFLHHDHGVISLREGMSRIDPKGIFACFQYDRGLLGGPVCSFRPHSNAVHRSRVIGWRRNTGVNRPRSDPSQRVFRINPF